MRLELIDWRHDGEAELEVGTCDFCLGTETTVDNPRFVFRDSEGEFEVPAREWDWGNYYDVTVHNVAAFGAWLRKQDVGEFEVTRLRAGSYRALNDLVNEFNNSGGQDA